MVYVREAMVMVHLSLSTHDQERRGWAAFGAKIRNGDRRMRNVWEIRVSYGLAVWVCSTSRRKHVFVVNGRCDFFSMTDGICTKPVQVDGKVTLW